MDQSIDLYVGFESPQEADLRQRGLFEPTSVAVIPPSEATRHPFSSPEFAWEGFLPRWEHENTTECAAAVVPSGHYDAAWPEGLRRYVDAARGRGEVAIVMCELGRFFGWSKEVPTEVWTRLPPGGGEVRGPMLPSGPRLEIPDHALPSERDLALRLRNSRSGGPWHSLNWAGEAGIFRPIIVTDLGEVVAVAWTSPDERLIWYLLPVDPPWETVLDWLETQALMELVPGALVRANRSVEDELLTQREREARDQLAEWERRAVEERSVLERQLTEASAWGDEKRAPLLFGSGRALVDAVAQVLRDAGLTVENLDETFGSGRSGDLLVSSGELHWLVEVTSSSGSLPEIEHGKLVAHLETWPRLRQEVLQGGVLIANHDYRQPPSARPSHPYRRREFVEGLKVRVVGTVPLCRWWVQVDFDAIVEAVTGPPGQVPNR